jgi:hypothetical protein
MLSNYLTLSNFKQPSFQHSKYQLLCIYNIPPDDGLQICPKHVEVDRRNKLRVNGASSWFSLHGCIEMDVNGTYNKAKEYVTPVAYIKISLK